MKKLYRILYIEIAVTIIGALFFFFRSPDVIPVHYNFQGEVDRFGSRYENLMWPAIMIVLGLMFAWKAKKEQGKGDQSNEKVMMITAVSVLAFFMVLSFYMMGKAVSYDPADPKPLADGTYRIMNIGMGILLIVMGNYMPKARKNSWIGLRNIWTLSSDAVWQKSQRTMGFIMVLAGFTVIIASLVFTDDTCMFIIPSALAAVSIVSFIISRYYYREEKAAGNEKAS